MKYSIKINKTCSLRHYSIFLLSIKIDYKIIYHILNPLLYYMCIFITFVSLWWAILWRINEPELGHVSVQKTKIIKHHIKVYRIGTHLKRFYQCFCYNLVITSTKLKKVTILIDNFITSYLIFTTISIS